MILQEQYFLLIISSGGWHPCYGALIRPCLANVGIFMNVQCTVTLEIFTASYFHRFCHEIFIRNIILVLISPLTASHFFIEFIICIYCMYNLL
jgi:hypothetical protein